MQLGTQSNIKIQSENLINKIQNSPISGSSYLGPFGFQAPCPDGSQNLLPSYSVLPPSIVNERVDDIPLLTAILLKLDIPNIVDKLYTPHGNHEGLSYGWLMTVWLVYILSRGDHRMSSVQGWVAGRCSVLGCATGQKITDKDFTDDRLSRLLKILYDDELWSEIEQHVSGHSIRAYDLPVEKVRLDATTASVNHDPDKHPLFQIGRTKQNTYLPQFKLMIGTLDPLGLPIATDVVSGEKADDPLYLPVYKRINDILCKTGILYIGDSKMGSLETRAVIDRDDNCYLMPLPMTGDTPTLLDKILSELEAGKHEISNVFLPQDIPTAENEKPDPEKALAKGFEITIKRKIKLDGEEIIWQERICCAQSFRYAASQSKALDSRLEKAEKAIRNLTPPPAPGKKQYQDESELKSAAEKILKRYKVEGLIECSWECQESHKKIRAYGDKPARVETTVRYQIHTTRNSDAVEKTKKRLGWRLYATNAMVEKLALTQVVLTYRDQYIVERNFARLKGRRLGITPLYVQRDDHACGLIRLLTIALRAMGIVEFSAHRKLQENQDTLQGIYPGNPRRSTASPSVDLLLEAFNGLDFFITDLPNGQHFEQISPLNEVQRKILYLLDLPESIYNKMTQKVKYGLQMGTIST
jgi:transposase